MFFLPSTDYRGYCAFTHKAGIHAKAILNNPSTYEILKPEDFGLTRYVSIGSVAGAVDPLLRCNTDLLPMS